MLLLLLHIGRRGGEVDATDHGIAGRHGGDVRDI
jgi:hypothetical protein